LAHVKNLDSRLYNANVLLALMRPTLVALSKASRRPLTPKRGNKDYYKGTRQAFLPGGLRTGAPGEYFGRSKAQYRIVDEKVRYFVAPPIADIVNSPLKPYVRTGTYFSEEEMEEQPFGKMPKGGLTGEHYLAWTSERHKATILPADAKS